MTQIVNMRDAKTTLSKLVALAEAGETVLLARDGTPVVRLVPLKEAAPTFGLGRTEERVAGIEAFAPLSDAEAAEWGIG